MSISRNRFTKNILQVMTSRGIMLISEILLGFVVPKILGITGYGYLKTYSLYTAYSALLHLGFVDGVLLYFAGQDYESLDKKKVRGYSKFFICMQCLVALALLVLCGTFLSEQFRFIGVMLAVNTFVINLTSYYQYVSQATQRFTELSIRNILIAISKILLVSGLVIVYHLSGNYVSYKIYIILLNVIEACLLIWYVYTYKDITFGEHTPIADCKKEIIGFFKNGFTLTIAYQVAHIVFILDRQFVSILYSAEIFAVYSFAYSLVAVCTKIISSLSTVLFPMLKQMKEKAALQYFSAAISLMLIVSGAVLAGYFPIVWFVNWFLPAYVASLEFLRIILPALLLSCCISVIIFTFYKVIDKNIIYFRISCAALGVSFLFNTIAHMAFHDPVAISWVSVLSMLIWYILAQQYFVQKYQIKWKRNLCYAVTIIIVFYLITILKCPWWQGIFLYMVGYTVVTILFFRKTDIAAFRRSK